jgi:hypothetical protein
MWVYGDRTRRVRPADLLAEVEADLAQGEALSGLIGLGQFAQAVADAEFAKRGCDARSSAMDGLGDALTKVAKELPSPLMGEGMGMGVHAERSPAGNQAQGVELDRRGAALRPAPIPTLPPSRGKGFLGELDLSHSSDTMEVRIPEGYAFYAVHPALYAAAAAQLPPGDWRVIGVRSIGTSLAAVVSAALGAPPPVTVRPVGHPFARELALSPELQAEWAAHPGPFAIVDEGPGLSGSSFGAAADALERLGVARERIAFLPGHGGDLGPEASPAHRDRWSRALRPVASFDDVVLPPLAAGVATLVGPAVEPMRDISGGAWRDLRAWPERPPAFPAQERRKFLHYAPDGDWLVKFAGLGRIGEAKLRRARALHSAGFTPEPAGLVEGFLVERWLDARRPTEIDRAALLDRLGAYLAFRAEAFPATSDGGASLATLAEMTRVNAAEALGPDAGAAAQRAMTAAPALEPRVRRVHVDGRLHPWEWLPLADGRLLKADALDHSEAHDLVGAQDVAWDLAGAEAEWDLDAEAVESLRRRLGVDPDLLRLLRPAYLAFQLGLWTLAGHPRAERYAYRLRQQLS